MITIAELRLFNWKCFRGDHVLRLEPKAYGIFARDEGDPKRSNWLGKSSLAEAVDYVLTGRLPRECLRKADWVTRGESLGKVELLLSNGSRISRSMGRTESERLFYFPPGVESEKGAAYQDAAQEKIDALLGLRKEDVGSWCFRQGEMAGILKMQDAKRVEMFSEWFRLGELAECQGVAAEARGGIEDAKSQRVRERDGVRESIERVYASHGTSHLAIGEEVAKLEAEKAELRKKWEEQTRQAQEASSLWKERQSLAGDAARYDALVAEGKALAAQLEAMPAKEALETERAAAVATDEEATRAFERARFDMGTVQQVATGTFSGVCPIAGETCPSLKFVNDTVVLKKRRSEEVSLAYGKAQESSSKARFLRVGVEGKFREGEQLAAKLADLRRMAKFLKPKRDRWAEIGDVPAPPALNEYADLDQATHAVETRLADLRAVERTAAVGRAKLTELDAKIFQLETAAIIPSAAALIFEQVRKEFAEENLAVIEGYANEMLGVIGVEVEVGIFWGREGDGLADACGGCGQAFSASRKVKHCARCGKVRGPKVVEKLDIVPTRRSGAADDFGGVSVSLGCSRWIREERESAWATAVLDEATAQMDESNRERFAARLPDVLRLAGFSQALVVSHHRETLEALPGRIEIVSSNGDSRVTVIA